MPTRKKPDDTKKILTQVAQLLSTDEMSVLRLLEHGAFPPPEHRMVTIRQISAWLGVSERTIYGWIKDGRFPQPIMLNETEEDFRATKRWYFKEVSEWLNGRPKGVGKTHAKRK
ncbi:MAG TPA: AlpA family phage regulatory protein [Alphaproteobacteria bacterium]|nr:AlpA family phage regulatory protein [Alphaproteobacteria bacterium]